jgi:hypothetical protein
MKMKAYDPKFDFVACKKSLDGAHRQWDAVFNLSWDQARCVGRFPLGRLQEPDGTEYTWHYYHRGAAKTA